MELPPKNKTEFVTRVPAIFRLGLSREMDSFLIASDLVAGFENSYYARKQWKWSIATEWSKIETFPMRIASEW